MRVPRQQQRELGRRHCLRVAERTRQLVGRLAMRADGRRVVGREGRELEHGLSLSGCVRVMRESRQIPVAAPALEQRCERTTVKAARAGGRDRLLDGQSGELVPERGLPVSGHEHTRRDALVEPRVDRAGERLDQPRLGVRRRDRNGVEHVSCAGREARPLARERRREPSRGSPFHPKRAPPSRRMRCRRSCGGVPAGRSRVARRVAQLRRGRGAKVGTRRRETADASSPSMSRNG